MQKRDSPKHRIVSIRKKIFFAMVVIALTPLVLFALFTLNQNYKNMYLELIDSRSRNMQWFQERMDINTKNYLDQFYEYEINKDLKSAIFSWAKDGQINHIEQSKIRNQFETTLSINPDINAVEICSLGIKGGFVSTRASFRSTETYPMPTLLRNHGKGLQTNMWFVSKDNKLMVMHTIYEFETKSPVAVLILHVQPRALLNITKKLDTSNGETLIILNDENQILFTEGDSAYVLNTSIMEKAKDEKRTINFSDDAIFFYKSIAGGKLQALYVVPMAILQKPLWHALYIGIIIATLTFALAVALSSMFAQIISRPIEELSELMHKSSIMDSVHTASIKRQDEIGVLQNSFHNMMRRNQDLITNKYQTEIEKKSAQIQALQAQINPHFMYNTLQLIGGMALQDNNLNMYNAVLSFSDIMRYSFDFSQEMVTLQEEISYLNSYIIIQNMRFSGRVKLDVNIPENLLVVSVPKLILQPMLENSFEHGFKGKKGGWHITLTAEESSTGDLILRIKDNGIGISFNKLKKIEDQLANEKAALLNKQNHIGIFNVHKRLFLKFGTGYGVKIASVKNEGTCITILTRK